MDGKRKKPRTLNQLRQIKNYGYRAPNGQARKSEAADVIKTMDEVLKKMDAIDAKLDFLLKYLELD